MKITPREKRRRFTIPEEKWGTTRSLTFLERSPGKFPGISGILKSSPVSRWKSSGEKACSVYEFSQGVDGFHSDDIKL